jgi:hypothetical protein
MLLECSILRIFPYDLPEDSTPNPAAWSIDLVPTPPPPICSVSTRALTLWTTHHEPDHFVPLIRPVAGALSTPAETGDDERWPPCTPNQVSCLRWRRPASVVFSAKSMVRLLSNFSTSYCPGSHIVRLPALSRLRVPAHCGRPALWPLRLCSW